MSLIPKSLATQIRQKAFEWILEREIFDRLFPHLEREKDCGYPFSTDEQMARNTNNLNVESLFRTLETEIAQMPKAYGEAFRHVMRRDIHSRLRSYSVLAHRRVKPVT